MPVKDRLEEMQKASKYLQNGKDTEETQIEMTPLNGKDKKDTSDFNQFLETAQELGFSITKIEKNVSEMKLLQKKFFNTPARSEKERFQAQLDDLLNENKVLGRKVQKIIKEEKERNEKLESKKKQTSKFHSELHIRKVQISTHSKRFLETWGEFNNIQVEHRDKVKKQLITNIKITGCEMSVEQIEQKVDDGDMTAFSSILEDTNKAKEDLMAIQNRHEDFLKLERGIVEIHGMFMEISNLISYQGEIIDRVENAILDAENQVTEGTNHLKKAEETKRSLRKKKICLIATGIIVALIILIIILSEFGAFSGGSGGQTTVVEHHYHLENGETIVSDKKLSEDQIPRRREAESTVPPAFTTDMSTLLDYSTTGSISMTEQISSLQP